MMYDQIKNVAKKAKAMANTAKVMAAGVARRGTAKRPMTATSSRTSKAPARTTMARGMGKAFGNMASYMGKAVAARGVTMSKPVAKAGMTPKRTNPVAKAGFKAARTSVKRGR